MQGEIILDLKKLSSFFLAAAMMSCMPFINAYAAEKTENGIKLVISTDKTSYAADDKIAASITLENNSESDITDITLEGVIPENYHLSEDSKAIKRMTYIASGDSFRSDIILIPDEKQVIAPDKKEKAADTSPQAEAVSSAVIATSTVSSASNIVTDGNTKRSEPQTAMLAASIILLAAGVVLIVIRKKLKNGMLVLLCITAAGSFYTERNANAEESETHIISVSETISVSGQEYKLTAKVRFTMDAPDMQVAVEEYYAENSEEIVSVENAEETKEVFTEKEAVKLMTELGFSAYPLTYDFNIDGTYTDEATASADSDEKHPMYQTYYVADNNSIWTVFIIGRSVFANPASYNLESDLDAQVLVSETDTLKSYTEFGNTFYETVPKESAVILKVVDQITSQKLNELKYEEVINQ